MLDQRPVDDMLDHFRREPIGRVIFAKSMPLLAVDQRFVENLQNVAFDLGETETPDMVHDAAHEVFALSIRQNPIKKIAFNRAGNPRRLKRTA